MEALPVLVSPVSPREKDVPVGSRCPRFLKLLQQRGKHYSCPALVLVGLTGKDEEVSSRLRDRNWVLAMEVMIPLSVGVRAEGAELGRECGAR